MEKYISSSFLSQNQKSREWLDIATLGTGDILMQLFW